MLIKANRHWRTDDVNGLQKTLNFEELKPLLKALGIKYKLKSVEHTFQETQYFVTIDENDCNLLKLAYNLNCVQVPMQNIKKETYLIYKEQ